MQKTILLIENEPKICDALKQGLEESGYIVLLAPDVASGMKLATTWSFSLIRRIDLIIVADRLMVEQRGPQIYQLPDFSCSTLLLSGLDPGRRYVQQLRERADDYLENPFSFAELSAKIRAIVGPQPVPVAGTINPLKLCDLTRTVTLAGRCVTLGPKEYVLLRLLLERAEGLVSCREILEQVWGLNLDEPSIVGVTVDHVRNQLRNLGASLAIRRVGSGFVLESFAD